MHYEEMRHWIFEKNVFSNGAKFNNQEAVYVCGCTNLSFTMNDHL